MKPKTISCILIALIAGIVACKKDKPVTLYMGYDYFPSNIGHWVIYNVDSISFNPLNINGSDTSIYQVEDIIDSFYTDNTGTRIQVIDRYKRQNPSAVWTYQKTYTANLTPTEALRTEDGVKWVKLVFPVTLNSVWNGGAFATIPASWFQWNDTSFQYTSVNAGATVGPSFFDSTLTVLQDNENLLTWHRLYTEQYAVNVGRIYKQIIEIDGNGALFTGIDPTYGVDSLLIPEYYAILSRQNRIKQGSTEYTETYVASGN